MPFLVSTTGMTGSNTGGSFVATSGTLFVKETQQNVATSVTVNGTSATVSGDTNADGSLDLSFPTTWALLFSL